MEDTKSLLIMVLHKIFHDRPQIVEDTYQLIYNFNNGKRESTDYEKTLKSICDLMNDELPSEILVYLLTLVDMPEENKNQPPVIEKIQKTYNFLSKSVRPALLEYLSNKKTKSNFSKSEGSLERENITEVKIQILNKTCDEIPTDHLRQQIPISSTNKKNSRKLTRTQNRKFQKHIMKVSNSEENESLGTLQDITAKYVIKNQQHLKIMYKSKLSKAWKLINSNTIDESEHLQKCYRTVEDLNKKTKLLRCIENNNVTDDLFLQENIDIIVEKNLFDMPANVVYRIEDFLK